VPKPRSVALWVAVVVGLALFLGSSFFMTVRTDRDMLVHLLVFTAGMLLFALGTTAIILERRQRSR
jgi:membrane protein DedA with SNARE-associated domain